MSTEKIGPSPEDMGIIPEQQDRKAYHEQTNVKGIDISVGRELTIPQSSEGISREDIAREVEIILKKLEGKTDEEIQRYFKWMSASLEIWRKNGYQEYQHYVATKSRGDNNLSYRDMWRPSQLEDMVNLVKVKLQMKPVEELGGKKQEVKAGGAENVINDVEGGVSKEDIAHEVELKDGSSITVKETEPGTFEIVRIGDYDTTTDTRDFAFDRWDDSVQDLDNGYSDIAQNLYMSTHLQWKDVILSLNSIKAPSLDRLKEALKHIEIDYYDPDDM